MWLAKGLCPHKLECLLEAKELVLADLDYTGEKVRKGGKLRLIIGYMKLAMDKCVELRVPTSEYVLQLLDLDDAWERPAAGDHGEGDDRSLREDQFAEYQT